MALKEYIKKRNFKKTPEPSAKKAKSDEFIFVVQKHRSRRHHYDFRLENRGVLKSWAVPKGISTNSADKRLAIMVEDHPFDYKDFEGLIPQGNYGAGSVLIWDEGTYVPLVGEAESKAAKEKLVDQAIAKGHLSIILKGKKLRGEFALIKLKRGKDQWLIIKRAENLVSPAPIDDERSVRTGRTLEDIENEKAAIPDDPLPTSLSGIDFKGAQKRKEPEFVEPMLATLVEQPFDKENWIFEVKWDGYRSIALIKDGNVNLFSRSGKTFAGKFAPIEAALKDLQFNAIFDGEITVLDKDGRPNFQLLQEYILSRKGALAYYVFDCLYAGSYDLRGLPLKRRREILKKILPVSNVIRHSDYIEKSGIKFFGAAEQNGLEGMVAKSLTSKYSSGVRSKEWLKIKAQKRQQAVICGFTQGRASRKYFGALVLGIFRDGKLSFAGHAGTGLDEDSLKSIYEKLKPLITDKSPFTRAPKTNMPVTWVKPELVVEVKFREWTKEGYMRQPVILGLSDAKNPAAAVAESEHDEEPGMLPISSKIHLTNLYKVFWPKEGYIKKDLVRYYWRMSDFILPYIKDRPQSLNRHPDGITGESFFQKDVASTAPEWAKTVKVKDDNGKEITYLLCQDTDTLVYMANLGCIEINVWNSVATRLEKPDYVVFDFDPIDVPFSQVVEAVLETKKVLDKIKAPAFCKTSGGKGMHIYVPIKPIYTYDQAKDFAHLINIAVHKHLPKTTSLERMPEKRKGLVYLDYLQNRYGATMAAPYSLRPREGATVSMPLDWSEVTEKLNPAHFNINTILKRVEKKGDLWKGLFKKRFDLSKILKTKID